MTNLVEGELKVYCPICNDNKPFNQITYKHLKTHKLTIQLFKEQYPTCYLIHPVREQQIKEARKEATKSIQTHNQQKKIQCIYCNCDIFVKKNESNKQACKKCIDSGKENPDGRTKKEAYQKRSATWKKKYGIDNIAKREETIKKRSKTNEERYGGTGFASESLARKTKETIKEKYETDNFMKTEEAKKLFSGSNNPMSKNNPSSKLRRESVSRKLKDKPSKLKNKSYTEIYGEERAKEINKHKSALFRERFINNQLEILLDYFEVDLLDKQFLGAHVRHNWKCRKCEFIFIQSWNAIQQGYQCPICYPRFMGDSKSEREIREFIRSLGLSIIENDKQLIKPKEVDIFIPSKNFAIELNGIFYHSEVKKDKKYHLEKTISCEKKGITLMHIFEDEWIYKKDIVKSMISHKLGLSNSKRINARQCTISEIDNKEANLFLDTFHIQGKTIGDRVKLGAFYNNELVSIMTFRSNDKINSEFLWELNRFCSNFNYHIPGIASKLLSYFRKNFLWEKIFTFSERRLSNGNLYKNLGFTFTSYTDINFWYTNGGLSRKSRQFVISEMKKEVVPEGITQEQFMAKKGYFKIYGCGNLKFEINVGKNGKI
jgi:hypothetical protein